MTVEVIATPRAQRQIAGLDRRHARAFEGFLDDLAARGCKALGYRLSGPTPVDHMCVKHLRGTLRAVVAFEGPRRAWVLLVGPHDDEDPVLNVYAELYRLLGADPRRLPGVTSRRAAIKIRNYPQCWVRRSRNSPGTRREHAGQGAGKRRDKGADRPKSLMPRKELTVERFANWIAQRQTRRSSVGGVRTRPGTVQSQVLVGMSLVEG